MCGYDRLWKFDQNLIGGEEDTKTKGSRLKDVLGSCQIKFLSCKENAIIWVTLQILRYLSEV